MPTWLTWLLLLLISVRVGAAVWAAVWTIKGDYYASMPGAYVRTFNPTLWESPDMEGAWGYHKDTYFHGPSQYLTLYYLAALDSYAAIARLLLPIYIGVIAIACWLLLKALLPLGRRDAAVPLLASALLFFPLLQAFIQREFEVIVFAALCAVLWLLVSDRRTLAAALMAYVSWYKYAALVLVGYLALRRWWQALVAFAVTSIAVLGAAELVFGLGLFFNNNVPAHATQVLNVYSNEFRVDENGHLFGVGFCTGWFDNETTLANVRHGLCTVSASLRWLPPHLIYVVLCGLVAFVYLRTHGSLEKQPLAVAEERWRRALELSIVITSYTCFLFNHYYYLIVLVIPFNVLLARYLDRGDWRRLALWVVAYVLISAFLVPTSILTRLAGIDMWAFFINGAWFMYGELILMSLLLSEYRGLARQAR